VVAGPETFVSLVHHCNYSVEKYLERLGHTLRSALIEPAISAAQRSAAQRSAARNDALSRGEKGRDDQARAPR